MDTSIVKLVNVVVVMTTISFLLLGNVCCQQTPAADTDKYEGVQVNSNGTNNTPTPNNLRVTFRFGSFNVSLSLQRNPNVPSNCTVIVGKKGVLTRTKTNSSEKFAHYIDASSDASVLVRVETDGDGYVSHSFTGVFKIGNDMYAFEPSTRKRRRRRRRGVLERMERDTPVVNDQYVVHKEITQLDATSPSLTLPRELLKPPTAERQDPDSPGGGNSIDKPPEKPNYVVELMVFVDYNIYKKMYDLSTESDKETDTLQRIKEYFGHIINGVDLRYRGINDSSFSINVRLVGFYVAQDANSSAFIENNRQGSGSSAYIAAQKSAYDFADWVNANKDLLPLFDQASLFTSEFLNGANGDRISGLAFYRSICSYYSVLLIRDSGEYGSSQTAAHELGHNLGAGHDGIDNMCSASDQHIMVASSGPLTDAVYKNAYTFSTCSIDEMKSFLVTMSPNSCLQRLSSNSTVDTGTFEIPLGKLYRPDEQCAILYGNGSFYCSGHNEDQQICRSMGCYHPVWKYCLTPFEQRAFSGTQCGDHKWCFMGDCVSDPRADALYGSDDCMYGDSKAPFYDGFKCSNVTSQPWNCYKSTIANACCQSCNAIRDDNLLGCEYGDLYPGCRNYEPLNCDDPSINSGCCQTCMDTQRLDCQSGDKITGCSAMDCLDERKYYNCCRTCASYPIPLPTSTTTTTKLTSGKTTQTTISTTTPTTTTTSMTTPTIRSASTTTTTTTSTTTPKTTSTPATSTTTQTTSTTPTTTTTATTTPTTTTTTYRPTLQLSQSCVDYDSVWCRDARNFPPSNCYTSNMVYCCAYCYSIRDYSRPGCEYGDRYSWCSTSRCSNDDERKTCCGKCKDFLSTTTTTTSTTTRTTTTPTTTTTSPTTTRTTTTPTTTTTTPTTTTTTPTTTTTTPTTTTTTTKTSTPTTTTTTPTKTSSTTTTTKTTATTTTTTTTTTRTTPLTTKSSTTSSTAVVTFKTTPTVERLTSNLTTTTSALKLGQETTGPSCEDKSSICANLEPVYCYSEFFRTFCCKTCSNLALGSYGCEYGDRYISLCVRVAPGDCYMYRYECCRTCQGL